MKSKVQSRYLEGRFFIFMMRFDPYNPTFHSGSGADCRKLVQELNMKRGTVLDETDSLERPPYEQSDDLADDQAQSSQMMASSNSQMKKTSRWDKYL